MPTWPTCSSCARRPGAATWRFGPHSVRAPPPSHVTSSRTASCSQGRAAASRCSWPSGVWMRSRRSRQSVRSGLVIAQVALALILVVGAGLLVESFRRLRAVDLGLRAEGVLTAQLYLPYPRYDTVPKMWRFYDAALNRVRALPGVRAAGLTTALPLGGGFGCTVQGFEDPEVSRRVAEAGGTLCAGQEPTSPGYFEAMGIPVLRGRGLTQEDLDHPERGAVVVSKAFAERFWPGEDPIGKGVGPNGRTNQQFYRLVGVVGDVYAESPVRERGVAIYY